MIVRMGGSQHPQDAYYMKAHRCNKGKMQTCSARIRVKVGKDASGDVSCLKESARDTGTRAATEEARNVGGEDGKSSVRTHLVWLPFFLSSQVGADVEQENRWGAVKEAALERCTDPKMATELSCWSAAHA
eukprot:6204768-Pleurochrysis_carterae.AAC.4